MIERYTRKEMAEIWTQESRFQKLLFVEIAVAETQANLGIIPAEAAKAIRSRAHFSVSRINQLEETTKHDVIAFVSNVAENVGKYGRYVHYGLTSSDVLDTAMSLVVREAAIVLMDSIERLDSALRMLTSKYAHTLCAGRTHGMHAEPTTFGMKMAGFLAELERNRERFERAIAQFVVGKLSGAVGTYSTQSHKVEEGVCKKLGLFPERIATQVIPRDRHAEVLWSLSMIGSGLERLAVELRHLQRTEVSEVVEGFSKGQKGSSAMPHKKNPISAENLTGCARLLRAYSGSAMENIALWHERDISHSSVERVVFPDAFILCDYACDRAARLLESLFVDEKQMMINLNLSRGQLFSSHLLLALVEKGMSREDAYAKIQALSHQLKERESLHDAILGNSELRGLIGKNQVDEVFSGKRHLQAIKANLIRSGMIGREAVQENQKAQKSAKSKQKLQKNKSGQNKVRKTNR